MKQSLFILSITFLIFGFSAKKSLTKTQVEANILKWYTSNENGYQIEIDNKGLTEITRYHTERPEEPNTLIRVTYKGMEITMAFDTLAAPIIDSPTLLQSHLKYYSIDNIYHDIVSDGWDISPKTPQSSNSKGLTFSFNDQQKVQFNIDWKIFTVMGYSLEEHCQKELGIADGSISEPCLVSVRQNLPINVSGILKK